MRPHNPNIDALIERTFPVLDHGFVRLVDYMGTDACVDRAARVSHGSEARNEDEQARLIRRLYRDRHTSPFEMAELKFHCKMPIFVARQWIRTRTANVNEASARYRESECEFFYPKEWRLQSATNKQGSAEALLEGENEEAVNFFYDSALDRSKQSYQIAIDTGVTRELARCALPVSTFTEWFWKIDLHNLLHFLRLRLAPEAQEEIRVYAEVIAQIVKVGFPAVWGAFEEFELYGARFSRTELRLLKAAVRGIGPILKPSSMTENEWRDFNAKLQLSC